MTDRTKSTESREQSKEKKNQAGAKEPKTSTKAKRKAELVAETVPVDAAPEAKIEIKNPNKVTVQAGLPTGALAKAGKHSAKAIREAEAAAAKEARKSRKASAETAPKPKQKPPRSRIERAGKKYREVVKLIDKSKAYELAEALDLAVKTSPTKFDAAVELHVNLEVDPKQADQNIRDTLTLPAGSGKTVKIAVFTEGDDLKKAKDAGADIVGGDELLAKFDKAELDFDLLITTPLLMPKLGKYAKILGPKGLMPNPKSGTLSADISSAVKAAKAGKIEYRVDSAGIIHLGIGKVSFGKDNLTQNAQAVIKSIKAAKPASVKGIYFKSAFVATTMGPSIKINL